MIQPQLVLDSPTNRMLTYTKTDDKGAVVIVSVRANLADDDLVRSVIEILTVPRPDP